MKLGGVMRFLLHYVLKRTCEITCAGLLCDEQMDLHYTLQQNTVNTLISKKLILVIIREMLFSWQALATAFWVFPVNNNCTALLRASLGHLRIIHAI